MASQNATGNGATVRLILQQCLSARLMVRPASEDKEAEFVEIKRGLVVYVCFLKGATMDVLDKMVKAVLTTRLSSSEDGKLVSILDLPGDVLIVPQATLGGRLKGKAMQYHSNIDKGTGLHLYTEFVSMCRKTVEENAVRRENDVTVKHGTYGNTQVLSMQINGPYTHTIEL